MEILILIIILMISILIGFPIYIGLFLSSIIYTFISNEFTFIDAIQKIVDAPYSFILLAVPFFIFSGQLMNSGGITMRIFHFCKVYLGHLPGGLGYVNVFASLIFSGMSGTASADVGGLGMVEIKAMRQANYDDDFIFGVSAASSIIGPIIPPSSSFIVYGAFAGVSIGGLFIGGIIPGLVITLALMVTVYIFAKKRNYPITPKASYAARFCALKESFLALLTPVIIIGGIWSGFVTPTEAAALSCFYAIIVTIFIYKNLKWRDLYAISVKTVNITMPAMLIVVSASLFGGILNYENLDDYLLELILGITENKYVILLLVNLILFIFGMFLDVIAAMLLLLPILQPVTESLQIDPIQFGVIVVLNLMIGLLTPPVGIVLYILSAGTGEKVANIIRYVFPWLLPLVFALILINLIPSLTTYLPRLSGF